MLLVRTSSRTKAASAGDNRMRDDLIWRARSTIEHPVLSPWKCHMFGSYRGNSFIWRPYAGDEPNWFWRWMQFLAFGNRWVKDAD